LGQIVQASTLLVMDKNLLGDKDILDNLAPSLSILQVKKLVEQFQTDQ
jgi:hypothetical protein